tara:strand:- start:601 stop:1035 length:435 start_codon:yes stop_codon:yes gene_type:complete
MYPSPEKNIFNRIVTSPNLARMVGFQVFPIAVPRTAVTLPFLVYRRSNVIYEPEGALTGIVSMPQLSLQFASWSTTYDGVRELADALRDVLDGYTGTRSGVTINDMRLTSEVDDFLDPTDSGAQLPPAYEVRQLYQIRWQEASE